MPGKSMASIKDEKTYEALRDEGMSKEKAARIAYARASKDKPFKKGGKAAPYEEWTKDALYSKAQEIGIEGRSRMDKKELIHALRHH